MLQACLNGARDKRFHPDTPFTPEELAFQAEAVVAAGAGELHLHPRDASGAETLDPDIIATVLTALRRRVPGTPVGLSTHADIPPGGRGRLDAIARWTELPDYVSINLVEDDSSEMIALALEKGIGIEAGLWSVEDAERFVRLDAAPKCLRVLLEINEQDEAEGLAAAAGIRQVLARVGLELPILQHGFDATVWPLYRDALMRGLDSRIGLEDGRHLPNGEVAEGNAELIKAALLIARLPPSAATA